MGKFQLRNLYYYLENIFPNSSKSFEITIPLSFNKFINSKTTQLNFISGIQATSTTNDYQIDISNIGQLSSGTIFSVNVSSLANTQITMI